MGDTSNGHDRVAQTFAAVRSDAGHDVVRDWSARLPQGGTVLDVGCGTGYPFTTALVEAGLDVRALDASPTMVAIFRRNFPTVPVECAPLQDGAFLDARYDGVVAVGLVFLLSEAAQMEAVSRLGAAVASGGHLLFSAPEEAGAWTDRLTQRKSVSLGRAAYTDALSRAGLRLYDSRHDAGGSHNYLARRDI